PAADDHVLLPVHDVQVAVGVAGAHVAGTEPALGIGDLRGRLGPPEVALHHVVAADRDLARLTRGRLGPVLRDDLDLDPPHGQAVSAASSISTRACRASNLGNITRVARVAKPAFICTLCPKEWNSGSAIRCTSCGCRPNNRLASSAFCTMLLWVSSAPLGCPVVPLVYRITAVPVSAVATYSNVAGWRCVNSARVSASAAGEVVAGSAVSRTKCSQLAVRRYAARPALPSGSSAVPSKQKYAVAPESARW